MDKLISIDDERLWSILFDEACIEGQQADRIYKALEEIAQPAFDKEKVIEELKANMNSVLGISGQAVTFMFSDGYYNGVKDAIEIVEKGGIE